VQIYGADYPTADGPVSGIYIHVTDLADAHLLRCGTRSPAEHRIYNLGSGTGILVKQVIDTCRATTGHEIPAIVRRRRAGDPAVLVASSELAAGGAGMGAEAGPTWHHCG